jgi:GNAT superfamily N-acetyltransferase
MRRLLHGFVLWLGSFVRDSKWDDPTLLPFKLRPLTLRPPTGTDIPDLVRIESEQAELPPAFNDTGSFWRHVYGDRQCYVAAIQEDEREQVVGYIVYDRKPDSLEIARVVVHPHYRLNGFGSRLVNVAVGRLPYHQRARVICRVPDHRKDLHLFFASLGFTGYTPSQAFDVVPEDHYLFMYKLTPYVTPMAAAS